MPRFLPTALLALAACGGGLKAIYDTDPHGSADDTDASDTDVSDTDTGGAFDSADSASDSADTADSHADTATDTGSPPAGHDGVYSGSITVDFTIYGVVPFDTCYGNADADVDLSKKPQISGTLDCTFSGPLSLLGTPGGDLTGNVTTDPSLAGTVSIDGIVSGDSWKGQFVANTFKGTFKGSTTVAGYDLDYDGSFELYR